MPIYAAPARATDLSRPPPTFIDVGSAEVFRDEDIAYALRSGPMEATANCTVAGRIPRLRYGRPRCQTLTGDDGGPHQMAQTYPVRAGADMERLTGRIAGFSGAASGIGKATAERLAAEGAAVMVTDLNDEGGKTVVEALRNGGRRAGYLHLDVVSESEARQQAIAGIVDEFGGLDILVNNAGVHGEPSPSSRPAWPA